MRKYNLGVILLSILTFAIYYSQLSINFMEDLDDDWGIYDNPLVQDLNSENLKKIWFNETLDNYYMPLTYTSFAIDVAIWGNNALAMKLTNLLLFIGCGGLLFWLMTLFRVNKFLIFATVAIFLLHPIQVESIAWPACRRQSLSMFFFLATGVGYIKFFINEHKYRWIPYMMALVCYFLSLAAKSTTIVFIPIVLSCFLIYHLKEKSSFRNLCRRLASVIPFFLIGVFFILMNLSSNDRNFAEHDMSYNLIQHVLIVTGSFGFYLKRIFIGPYSFFYPIQMPEHFNYLVHIFMTLIACSFMAVGFYFLRKRKWLFFGAVVWFFISLIPSSLLLILLSDFPFNTADRYFIVASPGVFLIVSFAVEKIFKKYKGIALGLISVVLAISTYNQLSNWESIYSLIEHNIKHYPTEEMYHRLAMKNFKSRNKEKAFKLLDKSKHLDKGIFFNNPFYADLEVAYIYQEKGDRDDCLKLIAIALDKDLKMKNDIYKDSLLLKKAASIYPLSDNMLINIENYKGIRQELITTHDAVKKPKRL